jgi:hypothetical protein
MRRLLSGAVACERRVAAPTTIEEGDSVAAEGTAAGANKGATAGNGGGADTTAPVPATHPASTDQCIVELTTNLVGQLEDQAVRVRRQIGALDVLANEDMMPAGFLRSRAVRSAQRCFVCAYVCPCCMARLALLWVCVRVCVCVCVCGRGGVPSMRGIGLDACCFGVMLEEDVASHRRVFQASAL